MSEFWERVRCFFGAHTYRVVPGFFEDRVKFCVSCGRSYPRSPFVASKSDFAAQDTE